jgi:hypothetical protein
VADTVVVLAVVVVVKVVAMRGRSSTAPVRSKEKEKEKEKERRAAIGSLLAGAVCGVKSDRSKSERHWLVECQDGNGRKC